MKHEYTRFDLEAFLDEALPPKTMAEIEKSLRKNQDLRRRLYELNRRRDAGVHSLGEIWRRHRISCASREEMGNYLLGVMSNDSSQALEFHLNVVNCRLCQANLDDLRQQQEENRTAAASRRRKYFESSAGYLRKST